MIRKERCSAAEAQLIDVTAELSVPGQLPADEGCSRVFYG